MRWNWNINAVSDVLNFWFRYLCVVYKWLFSNLCLPHEILSQCSTIVRNTVVKEMIQVNGEHPILGPPSSLNPGAINLKFGTIDYVWGLTPHAKKKMAQEGLPGTGEISCSKVFRLFFKFFICRFLASSHIFGSIAVVFAPNGMFQWDGLPSGVASRNFSPINLKNNFLDFWRKLPFIKFSSVNDP